MPCTGVNEWYVHILKVSFGQTFSQVRTNNSFSFLNTFAITTGARQDWVLFLLIFVIVSEWILNLALLIDEKFGIRLSDTILTDHRLADEICVLENDQGKAHELLDQIKKWAAKTGLLLSVKKQRLWTRTTVRTWRTMREELRMYKTSAAWDKTSL